MQKQSPGKLFIPAPPTTACACNECPYMRLNTLEKLYLAMKTRQPKIEIPASVQTAALRPIQRMLAMS
jgi:quinolinate synthase